MPDWLSMSTILTGLAGLIAIAAAIISSIEQTRDANAQNKLLTRLDEKNTALIEAQSKLNDLQQDSLDHFTGGESIFYLHFDMGKDKPVANMKVKGKHPVPTPLIEIFDFVKGDELHKSGEMTSEEIKEKMVTRHNLETVWPDSGLMLTRFPFTEKNVGLYAIFISQPKGNFVQIMRMKKLENGSYGFAYQMFKNLGIKNEKTEIQVIEGMHHCDEVLNRVDEFAFLLDPEKWNPGLRLIPVKHSDLEASETTELKLVE